MLYNQDWIPIFSPPTSSINTVYFTTSEEEAKQITNCAGTEACSEFFNLKISGPLAVWQNTTPEDFLGQVESLNHVNLTQLEKTTIDGHQAWLGYADENQKIHHTVIHVQEGNSSSLQIITANSDANTKQMMTQYLSSLPNIQIGGINRSSAKEFQQKKGFLINISSDLSTQDFFFIEDMLRTFLTPSNSPIDYGYILLTKSDPKPKGEVGGANYPETTFNQNYYLLTDNPELNPGKYGTSQLSIEVSPTDDNLTNYLADPKFCQQDNDCQYRANFCTVGAYNPYHVYRTPWGCGPGEYEGLGNSLELEQSLGCDEVVVNYDSIGCVNNSCQLSNPQPVCK